MKQTPRGIRNNNPLNIRIGNVWLGECTENTDGEFEQFVSMKYGLRAAFVLLRRYICHYRLLTIKQIVARWAPSKENDTERYIKFVSARSGIPSTYELSFSDQNRMVDLVEAMVFFENGQAISKTIIVESYKLA